MPRPRKADREVMTTISVSISFRDYLDQYKRKKEPLDKTLKRLLTRAAKIEDQMEEREKVINAYYSFWKQLYEQRKNLHEWKPEHPNRIKIIKWFINELQIS